MARAESASPELKACHGKKEILFPAGSIDVVQQRLPVQLFRLGQLYVVGIPAEVTIVSGLRLRRAVAAAVGTGLENVLVQGYANAYAHYVTTPEEYMGDVIGDLNARRGQIQAMDERAGVRVVRAQVPLSEMFGYVGDLRSKTQGRANYSMQFDSYAEVPQNVAKEIIAKATGE